MADHRTTVCRWCAHRDRRTGGRRPEGCDPRTAFRPRAVRVPRGDLALLLDLGGRTQDGRCASVGLRFRDPRRCRRHAALARWTSRTSVAHRRGRCQLCRHRRHTPNDSPADDRVRDRPACRPRTHRYLSDRGNDRCPDHARTTVGHLVLDVGRIQFAKRPAQDGQTRVDRRRFARPGHQKDGLSSVVQVGPRTAGHHHCGRADQQMVDPGAAPPDQRSGGFRCGERGQRRARRSPCCRGRMSDARADFLGRRMACRAHRGPRRRRSNPRVPFLSDRHRLRRHPAPHHDRRYRLAVRSCALAARRRRGSSWCYSIAVYLKLHFVLKLRCVLMSGRCFRTCACAGAAARLQLYELSWAPGYANGEVSCRQIAHDLPITMVRSGAERPPRRPSGQSVRMSQARPSNSSRTASR